MNISYNGRYQLRLKCGHNWQQLVIQGWKNTSVETYLINIHYERLAEHELTFSTFLMLLIVDVSNDLTFLVIIQVVSMPNT